MALLNLNFSSHTLGMNADVTVILPERRNQPHPPIGDRRYPVLYLLHGHSQDHTSYIRNSQIEFFAQNADVIIVMPGAHRSFYCDAPRGLSYFTYLTEELPTVISNWFPASSRREDNFVAGNSMGGYGAFKLALRRPDLFGGAASLSGCLTARSLPFGTPPEDDNLSVGFPTAGDLDRIMDETLGPCHQYPGSFNDLIAAVDDLEKAGGPFPCLYQCVGTGDYLYDDNRRFKEFMESTPRPFTYEYWEGPGLHNWEYWNVELKTVLKKFGLI